MKNNFILYEDESIIVINKPAGVYSHKNFPQQKGTSVSEIIYDKVEFSELKKNKNNSSHLRIGIVHRLDRDTNGIMICAKNQEVLEILQTAFKNKMVSKIYYALVHGKIYNETKLTHFLIRNKNKRNQKKASKANQGKEAVTWIKPLDLFSDKTLIQAKPITGRTHQIRIQLSENGHPIVGDRLYNYRRNKYKPEEHLYLCAQQISFEHPQTKKEKKFFIQLPPFFQKRIRLEKKNENQL